MVKRIITALILIPLVISGIFYLKGIDFVGAVGLILSWALWEWANIVGISSFFFKILYLLIFWGLFFAISFIPGTRLLWTGWFCWAFAGFLVISYAGGEPVKLPRIFYIVFGLFLFLVCWQAFGMLHLLAPKLVLFVLLLIWAADTGAYFVGVNFGKHKLAPRVSPKKSVEGLIGGIFFALLVSAIYSFINNFSPKHYLLVFAITIIVVLFALLGDLFESMVKRQAGVKDSGQLLPGHGGALDRVDSILAAVPAFLLCYVLFLN